MIFQWGNSAYSPVHIGTLLDYVLELSILYESTL